MAKAKRAKADVETKVESAVADLAATELPPCEILQGDCVDLMVKKPRGFANLAIPDPPYNFGQAYDSYNDNRPHEEYMAWTAEWILGFPRSTCSPRRSSA